MTNRFLISVAALALVAGTGFANAQGSMGRESGASGGSQQMQHNAQPSGGAAERGGAMNKSEKSEKGTVGQAGGASGTMKSGQSTEDRSSGAMNKKEMNKNEAAEDKAGASKGMRSDERAQGKQDKSKGMSSENTKSGAKDMKAEGREGQDKNMKAEGTKSGTSTNNAENRQGTGTNTNTNNAQNRPGTSTNMNAEGRTGTGTSTSSTTVGQAGAGAKLSTEQRTQITSVIRDEHVAPINNVNFSVAVGTRIPREGIELHALPSRVATIYPEWRSYRYVLIRDEIVIVDPNTYEIVAVLNV